jgi:hypothetical protein
LSAAGHRLFTSTPPFASLGVFRVVIDDSLAGDRVADDPGGPLPPGWGVLAAGRGGTDEEKTFRETFLTPFFDLHLIVMSTS